MCSSSDLLQSKDDERRADIDRGHLHQLQSPWVMPSSLSLLDAFCQDETLPDLQVLVQMVEAASTESLNHGHENWDIMFSFQFSKQGLPEKQSPYSPHLSILDTGMTHFVAAAYCAMSAVKVPKYTWAVH